MDRAELVGRIRNFNRFYTRTVGLLEETLSQSAFTLTEARVMFEIGHRAQAAVAPDIAGERGFLARTFQINVGAVASDIARDLRLDPAYLTRILKKFAAANLVEIDSDPADGRRRMLSLTTAGQGGSCRPAGRGRPRYRPPGRGPSRERLPELAQRAAQGHQPAWAGVAR